MKLTLRKCSLLFRSSGYNTKMPGMLTVFFLAWSTNLFCRYRGGELAGAAPLDDSSLGRVLRGPDSSGEVSGLVSISKILENCLPHYQ